MSVLNNLMSSRSKPAVFVKFQEDAIHAELGRYVFALLNSFSVSGYEILLADNRPSGRLGLYAAMAKSFPGVKLTSAVPNETSDKLYLFDVEDGQAAGRPWLRKIRVKFDVFAPYWFRRPILMPFRIHPVHVTPDLEERLAQFRSATRRMRMFFSGDMEGYTRSHIQYPGPKLPRLDVINAVRQYLGDRVLFVQDPAVLHEILSGEYVDKCVILDTTKFRIPDQEWLSVLCTADFFLSPPGIVMPMCHNSVEAMAVGAVPVINYGEWFDPPLRSMQNCVAFDSKGSLIKGLEAVFAMAPRQIAEMRNHAIDYYDSVLSAKAFMTRIETSVERRIEVLILTERYVAQNSRKLNRHSVLMRGSADRTPLLRILIPDQS